MSNQFNITPHHSGIKSQAAVDQTQPSKLKASLALGTNRDPMTDMKEGNIIMSKYTNTTGPIQETRSDHLVTDQSRLIKKKQLAARLSISPRTVDDLVAKRVIPYLALSPRLHLFDPEAVKHALATRFEVRAKGGVV